MDTSLPAEGIGQVLLQQRLVWAIVIAFGMTAMVVVLALRTYLETGSDHVDGDEPTGRP